jgi:hypothetical protein
VIDAAGTQILLRRLLLINPVAVEKLAHFDFAKIASRQEALQTIFPSLLDIFYHPTFDFFQKNRLFLKLRLLRSGPKRFPFDTTRQRRSFQIPVDKPSSAAKGAVSPKAGETSIPPVLPAQ